MNEPFLLVLDLFKLEYNKINFFKIEDGFRWQEEEKWRKQLSQ